MRPLGNQLLVIEVASDGREKLSPGGIMLTMPQDKGASKPGCVVAMGPDVTDIVLEDQIALEWNKGLPIIVAGTKCILISQEFVRGIYTDESES
jgi:co-chaperonin GroES (HSP10)